MVLECLWGRFLARQDWLSCDVAVPVLARKKQAAIINSVPNATIGVKMAWRPDGLPSLATCAIIYHMAYPTTATIKRLLAVSGNRCAFPGCESPPLVIGNIATGKVCHVKAAIQYRRHRSA